MSEAATSYLYSGEQFDSRIGQQYLRARYYNAATGTFNRLDPFFGNQSDPQSFHKYLYTHGDPVNGIDPTGFFFTLAGLGFSSSVSGNARSQNAASQMAMQTRLSRAIRAFSRVYSKVNKAWDWVNAARDAFDLLQLDARDLFRLQTVVNSRLTLNGPLMRISLPASIKRKFRRVLGPFYKLAENNVAQEWIGVLGSVLVGKVLGFEATKVGVGYTGIDGILHKPNIGFAIIEAKGGSSRLSSGQMEDRWIGERLRRLARTNTERSFRQAVRQRQPMVAMVVSLNIMQNELKAQMKTYPNVGSWDRRL